MELNENIPRQALENNLLTHWSSDTQNLLKQLIDKKRVETSTIKLTLLIGDARQTIQQVVAQNFLADAIFLDPFSPPKCPQLWTVEFLSLLANSLNSQGILALQLAGLTIGLNFAVGKRSAGTIATHQFSPIPPLSTRDWEHLKTRASIPLRDPFLSDTATKIRQRREEEQRLSTLESTSKWKKRWFSINSENYINYL